MNIVPNPQYTPLKNQHFWPACRRYEWRRYGGWERRRFCCGAGAQSASVVLSLDARSGFSARPPVNQSEAWQEIAMDGKGGQFAATIPAADTDSPFLLQYLFAVMQNGRADMAPGLGADLCNQPYYVLRQA